MSNSQMVYDFNIQFSNHEQWGLTQHELGVNYRITDMYGYVLRDIQLDMLGVSENGDIWGCPCKMACHRSKMTMA